MDTLEALASILQQDLPYSANAPMSPCGGNPLYDQMQSCSSDPREVIQLSLNNNFPFFRELFEQSTRPANLPAPVSSLVRALVRDLEQVLPEGSREHEKKNPLSLLNPLITISPQYIHSPRLMPLQRYQAPYTGAVISSAEHPVEQKQYIFLTPSTYELFARSPAWRPPQNLGPQATKAPSYKPLNRFSSDLGHAEIDKCTPICLQSEIGWDFFQNKVSAAALAIILAPIAKAYLIAQPGRLSPLGYLCFFEQIFGSGDPLGGSQKPLSEPVIKKEHIVPMACLAWCISRAMETPPTQPSASRANQSPQRFDLSSFEAPQHRFDGSGSISVEEQMDRFLIQLRQSGVTFDGRYPSETIQSQFDRLAASKVFQNDSSFIELVRSLCPLALPTKNDAESRFIKPFCYLEQRKPDGTLPQDEARYLQGYVTWSRTQGNGQVALYMARLHTIHRNDFDIKHPTMRVTRMVLNPDPFSTLGSWQYLLNGYCAAFRSIPDIEKYISRDRSGNAWISGIFVDSYHARPIMVNGERISPRSALLSATHFSAVDKSWLS